MEAIPSSDSPRLTARLLGYRAARRAWRSVGSRVLTGIRRTGRISWNTFRAWIGRADYKRWTSPQGLEAWWDERTKRIAELVPAGSSVIEFGAGRRQLEKYLPTQCAYTPSDLVDRGPGTIVFDLNCRPFPNLSHRAPEVAVFGGVLEYVRDVSGLIQWLADSGVVRCIASYDPMLSSKGRIARYSELKRRSYNGYMNHLTEDELVRTFKAAGFTCMGKRPWTNQLIFLFFRNP